MESAIRELIVKYRGLASVRDAQLDQYRDEGDDVSVGNLPDYDATSTDNAYEAATDLAALLGELETLVPEKEKSK